MQTYTFAGSDYDHEIDGPRLTRQHDRIKGLMLCGAWFSLSEISKFTNAPESSVSAQIRFLRRDDFGGYTVEKRRRGDRAGGLFEYRIYQPQLQQSMF